MRISHKASARISLGKVIRKMPHKEGKTADFEKFCGELQKKTADGFYTMKKRAPYAPKQTMEGKLLYEAGS